MSPRFSELLRVTLPLMLALATAPVVHARTTTPLPDDVAPANDDSELYDDTADLELLDLEVPIVVTAARRAQKITTVPNAVSIITADDIRASGARTIPDALRLAPGMDVAELSYSNKAVSVRGLHGFVTRTVLVLVDGRQLFDSLFGGTLWGNWPFQLEDIERIEIIRGPGGVTWGANAVDGVINIITKDPKDQLGLTMTLSGGSRGSFKKHVGYSFIDGKLRLRVSVNTKRVTDSEEVGRSCDPSMMSTRLDG